MSDNQDVISEMMEFQPFDKTVKSALENIEVPYDASTWDALNTRLDALDAPDAVDKVVKPVLERMETPYDFGNWSALARKMDGVARVRRIRMTKVAEAAIFLLLLLNLEGFFGVVESVTRPKATPAKAIGPVAAARKSKSPKIAPKTFNPATNLNEEDSLTLSEKVAAMVQSVTKVWGGSAEISPTSPLAPVAVRATTLDPALFYTQAGLLGKTSESILAQKAMLPVLFVANSVEISGIQVPFIRRSKHPFYAATFVRFDQNNVLDAGSRDQTNSFGGGLAVGYRKGKWGVEMGISYSQKNYRPKRETVEYYNNPFQGIGLFYVDEVTADVFTLPVKVTRQVAKVGTVRAHAVAGVSAQVAAQKNYAYQSLHFPPASPQSNPHSSGTAEADLPVGRGVLENGGSAHNIYTTVDLGLRVEQALGKRYVAFIEPLYSASLGGGFGPKTARINTFSLQAGILASL